MKNQTEALKTAKHLQDYSDSVVDRLVAHEHLSPQANLDRKLVEGVVASYQQLVFELLKNK